MKISKILAITAAMLILMCTCALAETNDVVLISAADTAVTSDAVVASDADVAVASDAEVTSDADVAVTSDAEVTSDADVAVTSDAEVTSDADVAVTSDAEVASDAEVIVVSISDLSEDDWAYEDVLALAQKNIIAVNENGTVCPDETITISEASKIVFTARGRETAIDGEADEIVTRAKLAVILVDSLNASTDSFDVSSFSDVAADEWYAKYVECAKTLGIVNGYPDGTFGGNNNITKKEAYVMINRMVKLLEALEA